MVCNIVLAIFLVGSLLVNFCLGVLVLQLLGSGGEVE